MKENKRVRVTEQDGYVLVMVLIITLVLSILGAGQLVTARLNAGEVSRGEDRAVALCLAERGMNEFRALASHPWNIGTFRQLGFLSAGDEPLLQRESGADDSYAVYVEQTGVQQMGGIEVVFYQVRSVANCGPYWAEITVNCRQTTRARDLMGSHSDGGVNYVTGDRIYGSIRSNNAFYILGSPVFYGEVITSSSWVSVDGSRVSAVSDTICTAGIKFNEPELPFDAEMIDRLRDLAGQVINKDCEIEFLPDDKYAVTTMEILLRDVTVWRYQERSGSGWQWRTSTTQPVPGPNIRRVSSAIEDVIGPVSVTNSISSIGEAGIDDDNIIYVNGVATVHGEVSGTISIVASDTIHIDGDVVYWSKRNDRNPSDWDMSQTSDLPAAAERLGLYAANKVSIINARRNTDVNIHASIFTVARGNSVVRGFCVEQYRDSLGSPYINLFGSIVQHTRGAVGTLGGWGGTTGFLKNYHYDPRFKYNPPPGNPPSEPVFSGWTTRSWYEE
jgi:hypothetical protein